MHPWTSLAPAGPGAPQGSWWLDPALPFSTVSATTPQVRARWRADHLLGGGTGWGNWGLVGGRGTNDNDNNNTSRGDSPHLPKPRFALLATLLILPILTLPLENTIYNSVVLIQ